MSLLPACCSDSLATPFAEAAVALPLRTAAVAASHLQIHPGTANCIIFKYWYLYTFLATAYNASALVQRSTHRFMLGQSCTPDALFLSECINVRARTRTHIHALQAEQLRAAKEADKKANVLKKQAQNMLIKLDIVLKQFDNIGPADGGRALVTTKAEKDFEESWDELLRIKKDVNNVLKDPYNFDRFPVEKEYFASQCQSGTASAKIVNDMLKVINKSR